MYIHKIFVLIAVIHTTCLLKLEAGCYPLFWSPFSQHSWVHTNHCQTYTLCPLFQGLNVSSGRPGHLAPVQVISQLCVSCLAVTTPCWGACYSCQVDWLQGLPLDVPYSHELVWWVGLGWRWLPAPGLFCLPCSSTAWLALGQGGLCLIRHATMLCCWLCPLGSSHPPLTAPWQPLCLYPPGLCVLCHLQAIFYAFHIVL